MKIYANINGEKRELNYSMEVMFFVSGEEQNGNDIMNYLDDFKNCFTQKGFEAIKTLLIHMVNDAEKKRRAEGYDPLPMLEDKDFDLEKIRPYMLPEWYVAIIKAYEAGMNREIDEADDEIDLGLEELSKKKEGKTDLT